MLIYERVYIMNVCYDLWETQSDVDYTLSFYNNNKEQIIGPFSAVNIWKSFYHSVH